MLHEDTYGGLFVLLGIGLLIIGLVWGTLLPFSVALPPLMIPASASILFGAFNLARATLSRRRRNLRRERPKS
jgi:predicted acyltransferase